MTTTPDPKAVREIAREVMQQAASRLPYYPEGVTGALVAHGIDGRDMERWAAYGNAVRKYIKTATVTVSWPDEQPQDDDTPDAERLAQIRDRNRRLLAVPFETHGGGHGPGCIPCELVRAVDDVSWLLERLSQQQAIIARVTDRMREYDRHGGGSVNIRQVLNLLSPTWPDGNYEAPAGGDHG